MTTYRAHQAIYQDFSQKKYKKGSLFLIGSLLRIYVDATPSRYLRKFTFFRRFWTIRTSNPSTPLLHIRDKKMMVKKVHRRKNDTLWRVVSMKINSRQTLTITILRTERPFPLHKLSQEIHYKYAIKLNLRWWESVGQRGKTNQYEEVRLGSDGSSWNITMPFLKPRRHCQTANGSFDGDLERKDLWRRYSFKALSWLAKRRLWGLTEVNSERQCP